MCLCVLKQILKTNSLEADVSFCEAYFTLHSSFHLKPPFHTLCVAVIHRLQNQAISELGHGPMLTDLSSHPHLCQFRESQFIV